MSVLTEKHVLVPHVPTIHRRAALLALVAAAVIVAAVVLGFALFGGSDRVYVPAAATPSAQTLSAGPGIRLDGGPEEGTRGAVRDMTGIRFDGGPEEGMLGAASGTTGIRLDGGPEEGMLGAAR